MSQCLKIKIVVILCTQAMVSAGHAGFGITHHFDWWWQKIHNKKGDALISFLYFLKYILPLEKLDVFDLIFAWVDDDVNQSEI